MFIVLKMSIQIIPLLRPFMSSMSLVNVGASYHDTAASGVTLLKLVKLPLLK